MAKKRVHEIAKANGISSKEVLKALNAAGINVKVAASSVDEDAAKARSWYTKSADKGNVSFMRRSAPPVEPARGTDAAGWFGRGEALEASDRAAAEAAYRMTLKLDPGHADASLNLGALLCEGHRERYRDQQREPRPLECCHCTRLLQVSVSG